MEKVENLLKDLRLSEAEKKGLRIGGPGEKEAGSGEALALGKVLSEKPAYAEGIVASLGKVWCPLKGTLVKKMRDNVFMFTFLQPSGRRKAVEDGPWKVGNDLLVVEEFVPEKSLDDYAFSTFPIWVRIFKLPLGRMNQEIGEAIGNEIGVFVEAEVGENGTAVGEYLRIKVRLNVAEPLRRGILLHVGGGDNVKWCNFEYEYLPQFCFTCGVVGHDDKCCNIILGKGEKQQYGKWMIAVLQKKRSDHDGQRDAEAILKIHIYGQRDDQVAWHYDSRGIFSVKSAYKVYALFVDVDRQAGTAHGELGSTWEKNVWKNVWKLECPPKVHHFLWRVAHDSLPMRMNIERRRVDLDTRCAICNGYFENEGHLFVSCSEAKKAWRVLSLGDVQQNLLNCTSGLEMIEKMLKLPPDKKMLSIAFIWCWWTERNKANRGERRLSLNELIFSVQAHTLEWHVFLGKNPSRNPRGIETWEAPPTDWILINTDGAFLLENGKGGWGAVGRDSDGDLVFAAAGNVPLVIDAFHSEAFGLLQGVKMASSLGIGRARFATDCLTLQQALSTSSYDLSRLGALISETKFILDSSFIEYVVSYVPRAINKLAHSLAALGMAGVQNDHQVWYEHVTDVKSRVLNMETYAEMGSDGGDPAPNPSAMEDPRADSAAAFPALAGSDALLDASSPNPGTSAGAKKRKAPATATVKAASKPRKRQVEQPIQMSVYYGRREDFFRVRGEDLVDDCPGLYAESKCAHLVGELPLQPQSMSLVDLQLWIFKLFWLHPETQDLEIKGLLKQYKNDFFDEESSDLECPLDYCPWDTHYFTSDKCWSSFANKLKRKRNVMQKFMLYVQSSEIKHYDTWDEMPVE
ncbi:hypothetical protein ACQ4PT_042909 [Festuca glaucescens]